ncbi:MAG: hypothetical protein VXX63_04955 [Bacteroidota bacterium]|nr:hypothetical protein [Bacteroidota bacterium]
MVRKYISIAWVFLAWFSSCKEGVPLENKPPETKIALGEINLYGPNRLNSDIQLSWYGTDPDGYIVGYEFSVNEGLWTFTKSQDTTFKFKLPPNKDTTDIRFMVRAIDNALVADPSPAILDIPIKNSPPKIEFVEKSLPKDSTLLVYTFQFLTSDQDGDESIREAYIRANDGEWSKLDLQQSMVSLVAQNPITTGVTNALVYYGKNNVQEDMVVDGFINGGLNTFYLKCKDQAGVESEIDTSKPIFIRQKTSDLLVVGIQPNTVKNAYQQILQASVKDYDLVDYFKDGGQNFPKFWNPSFSLMAKNYPKMFFFSDQSTVSNPFNNQTGLALSFAASSLQRYNDEGGKVFISTSFPRGVDFQNLSGPFPIDSVSTKSGQALMSNDSFLRPTNTPPPYLPLLQSTNVQLGLDPVYHSVDAEVIYDAQLFPIDNWTGPRAVGLRRTRDNQVLQVFFSTELYLYDKYPDALNLLFDIILNQWFE